MGRGQVHISSCRIQKVFRMVRCRLHRKGHRRVLGTSTRMSARSRAHRKTEKDLLGTASWIFLIFFLVLRFIRKCWLLCDCVKISHDSDDTSHLTTLRLAARSLNAKWKLFSLMKSLFYIKKVVKKAKQPRIASKRRLKKCQAWCHFAVTVFVNCFFT